MEKLIILEKNRNKSKQAFLNNLFVVLLIFNLAVNVCLFTIAKIYAYFSYDVKFFNLAEKSFIVLTSVLLVSNLLYLIVHLALKKTNKEVVENFNDEDLNSKLSFYLAKKRETKQKVSNSLSAILNLDFFMLIIYILFCIVNVVNYFVNSSNVWYFYSLLFGTVLFWIMKFIIFDKIYLSKWIKNLKIEEDNNRSYSRINAFNIIRLSFLLWIWMIFLAGILINFEKAFNWFDVLFGIEGFQQFSTMFLGLLITISFPIFIYISRLLFVPLFFIKSNLPKTKKLKTVFIPFYFTEE